MNIPFMRYNDKITKTHSNRKSNYDHKEKKISYSTYDNDKEYEYDK